MKSIFCFKASLTTYTLIFLSFSGFGQSQKEVNETCETNNDCQSGNCVTLKSGNKKCSDCAQDKLDDYTRTVDEKCHEWDKGILGYSDLEREFGSKTEVSLVILNYRMDACKACYLARSNREQNCWKGGDPGHEDEMEAMKKAMKYLEGLMD